MPSEVDIPESLLEAIGAEKCIAFVGAGVSAACEYKDWGQLTQLLAEELNEDPDKVSTEQCPQLAQRLFDSNEPRYREIITEEYSGEGKDPHHIRHLSLLKTKFLAYVTTNIDNCLNNAQSMAGIDLRTYTYPRLPATEVRGTEPSLFHIHGCITNFETIVLKEDDYTRAYQNSSFIADLIKQIYLHHTIMFIGFSFKDPDLIKILQLCKQEYQKLVTRCQGTNIKIDAREMPHYAFLPMEIEKKADLTTISQSTQIEQDESCKAAGINVIRFGKYTDLSRLLERLRLLKPRKRLLTDTVSITYQTNV